MHLRGTEKRYHLWSERTLINKVWKPNDAINVKGTDVPYPLENTSSNHEMTNGNTIILEAVKPGQDKDEVHESPSHEKKGLQNHHIWPLILWKKDFP